MNVTRAARLRVTVETPRRRSGRDDRRAPHHGAGALPRPLAWHHRGGRALVYGGDYVLRFRAANELGAAELTSRPFKVVRAAPAKKKPKKQS